MLTLIRNVDVEKYAKALAQALWNKWPRFHTQDEIEKLIEREALAVLIRTPQIGLFLNEMQDRVVRFRYRKTHGTIREACGTLNYGIIPHKTRYDRQNPNPELICYFDLEKMEWRAFRVENFLDYRPL